MYACTHKWQCCCAQVDNLNLDAMTTTQTTLARTPSRSAAQGAAAAPRVKRVARARQAPKLRAVAAGGGPAWAGGVPSSVMAVIAAAFLNLLGFTMTGPITPDLAKHFGLPVGGSAPVGARFCRRRGRCC